MDYQVTRDMANRIIEVDGVAVASLPEAQKAYLSGIQDAILGCRQQAEQYSRKDSVLNTMIGEIAQNVMSEVIRTLEYNLCAGVAQYKPTKGKTDGKKT